MMRFKNYRNSYTNDNRIYSKDEMLDMTIREIKDRAEEFIAQHRVLGLPDEKELAGSDMSQVWGMISTILMQCMVKILKMFLQRQKV